MELTQNLLQSFLIVYFYQLEQKLNSTKNELEKIKFESEEVTQKTVLVSPKKAVLMIEGKSINEE